MPLAQWFRKELREMAHDTLFSAPDGILDQNYLKKIWDDHQAVRHDRSAYLWSVLMFRKWKATFAA